MVKAIIGDVRKVYNLLEDNSIDCVITSPPYWQQRDYGIEGQIGQETSPEDYAKEIAYVFELLWPKLKTTATIFLNIGYKFQNEEFLLIPELVAFEMRKLGYMLKNKIIWYKPNAMPTPARNRLNNTYEAVFFFVKNVGKEVFYFNLAELYERSELFTPRLSTNIESLLSGKIEDNLTSRGKREGIVTGVNKKFIKVLWDDGQEENIEFAEEQKEATFRCENCSHKVSYWDILLSYANYGNFLCPNCKTTNLPIPEFQNEVQEEREWFFSTNLSTKSKLTYAKGSEKYKKAKLLTSSPAGRLAITGEKLVLKRKWIFPQPLIADYLKRHLKKSNITIEALEKLLGYNYTAAHWLRKDFSHWGKGGSLPRPSDWSKLKDVLKLDSRYDRLLTDVVAMISTVRPHPKGKNIGDVWEIPTEPYEGEHFAVFPKKLVERCIKLGCPPGGTVLDPFAGSGTVGEVAQKLNRKAILIEINPDYKKLILGRCGNVEFIE